MDPSNTPEARAVRAARQAEHAMCARRGKDCDALAERARLVAFWKACAETNSGYIPHNGAWWCSFRRPNFRHLLMPSVRARLDARDAEHERRYREEMRQHCERWKAIQAERRAEKLAARRRAREPQAELFTGGAA